jgi:hypothetical protein
VHQAGLASSWPRVVQLTCVCHDGQEIVAGDLSLCILDLVCTLERLQGSKGTQDMGLLGKHLSN